jgi:Zn-finger nucleic acid-binding protein
MKCPRCPEHELARQSIGGLEVEKCDHCQGLWLEVGLLEDLLKQTHDYTRRRISRPVDTRPPESTLECPACGAGARMIRIKAPGHPKITFDGCPVCHGRWLDGGELAQLGDPSILDRLRTTLKQWL